jgi:hypothetical protein
LRGFFNISRASIIVGGSNCGSRARQMNCQDKNQESKKL